MPRSTSRPSNRSSSRPTARCSDGPGNRGPTAAPQNLYKVAGPDEHGRDDGWVAIAVATDEQWSALCGPPWAIRRGPPTPSWRPWPAGSRAHDRIDTLLGEWCRARSADEIVTTLWEAGVPVGKVMQPHDQPDLPQLAARGFFEELDHPVIGSSRYSTLPMRFSRGPEQIHQRHAPLLGEHNESCWAQLGLSPAESTRSKPTGSSAAPLPRAPKRRTARAVS